MLAPGGPLGKNLAVLALSSWTKTWDSRQSGPYRTDGTSVCGVRRTLLLVVGLVAACRRKIRPLVAGYGHIYGHVRLLDPKRSILEECGRLVPRDIL
jgi:hypothetical protein